MLFADFRAQSRYSILVGSKNRYAVGILASAMNGRVQGQGLGLRVAFGLNLKVHEK